MRVEKTDEYREWIDGLKDQAGRARVLMRVDRLIHGNPGNHRNLTEGVSELKVDVGPGSGCTTRSVGTDCHYSSQAATSQRRIRT
jgi:putative addiction module killer protein